MLVNFNFIGNTLDKLLDKLAGWGEGIILKTPNFFIALIVFIIFWQVGKHLSKFLQRVLLKKPGQESIKRLIARALFIIIVMIGFFVALGILDLDKVLTSVLAGAGVIGLAIGLALQGTLNNTFSGIILSFLPNIQIGDWIETNNHAGKIVDINLRSVTILESDNNYVVIPNSKIMESPFKNFSGTTRSRITVKCGVGYESDLEFVKTLTTKVIEETFEQLSGEEVEFYYTEFGDSSIDYIIRFWTNVITNREIIAAKSTAILAIKKAYNENNVNIPFPIRTLDFAKNKFRAETLTINNKKEEN